MGGTSPSRLGCGSPRGIVPFFQGVGFKRTKKGLLMGKQNRLTEVELGFIEHSFPRLSCAEIAKKLGRTTRCVEKAVRRLGLRSEGANIARPRDEDQVSCEGAQDELAELREIKRTLKRALREDALAKDMPKLSAELREVIKRISEIEEGDGDGSSGSLAGCAGNITVTVPLRPA